jgi:hypothetical protein
VQLRRNFFDGESVSLVHLDRETQRRDFRWGNGQRSPLMMNGRNQGNRTKVPCLVDAVDFECSRQRTMMDIILSNRYLLVWLSGSFRLLFACALDRCRSGYKSVDNAGPAIEPLVVALEAEPRALLAEEHDEAGDQHRRGVQRSLALVASIHSQFHPIDHTAEVADGCCAVS